jgi:hypothetical protein
MVSSAKPTIIIAKNEPEKLRGDFADKPTRDEIGCCVLEADQDDRELIV